MMRREFLDTDCPACGDFARGEYVTAEFADADASEPIARAVSADPCERCVADAAEVAP